MKRFIITIILLLSAAIANYAFSRPEAELPRRALREFPKVIGDWKAVNEQIIDERSMAILLVDDYIMRTYVNAKGESVGLYIGYFKTQREGKQVHSPRQCLPGAGWSIAANKVYSLELQNYNPTRASVNYYLMQYGDRQEIYLWWYQGRGRIYANEYLNKLLLIWDSIIMRRTDGALVRVNMPAKDDINHSLKTQTDFINLFAPLLSEYMIFQFLQQSVLWPLQSPVCLCLKIRQYLTYLLLQVLLNPNNKTDNITLLLRHSLYVHQTKNPL